MRHILFLLFAALTLQAFAQYPATGNKARLGWQTTGDGLVYRGAIGDTTTLDPSGLNNAWMLLDTASGNLYAYRTKAWRLVSGGGGGGLTMPFDSVTFNVNETDASLRELKYSEEKGYLQYGGQDSVQIPILPGIWYVRNDDSVTISKGMVLRASGTLGASGRIKVKRMIADGSIDAMYILGIAMHDIAVGADGYAMSQGKIRQVNTQAYSEGAVLYADVDTLGGLTQTEPGNGFLKLPIAFVVHSASNGVLAVRVTSGAYMRDLHDVEVTSPATNASLYYNTAQGIWRDTGAAVLVADTAAMLTNYINVADTATMLSSYISNADTSVFARDFQISGTANYLAKFTGSNTVGNSVAYENGRSVYINSTQDNSGYSFSNAFQFNGFGSGGFDQPVFGVIGNVGTTFNHRPYLSMYRSAGSTVNDKTLVPYNYYLGSITWQGADGTDFQPRGAEITAITDSITGNNDMPTALFFGTTANGQEQPTERMRITSAGNVGINTTTPAYRLDVNGDVNTTGMYKKSGTDIISGTTNRLAMFTGANTVGNSGVFESGGNVGIGTASPGEKLHINGSLMIERASDILGSGGIFFKRPGTSSYNWLIRQGAYPGTNDDLFIDRNIGGTWYTGIAIDRENLNVGIATASPSRPLHVNANSSMIIPSGATGTRPSAAANGDIRYNTDKANFEWYSGTGWREAVNAARKPADFTANRFSKFDANGLLDTSAVLIQNGSNIGIGTSSATNLLTIKSQSTSDIPVSVRSSAASNINIVALSESNGAGAVSLKDKNGNTDIVLNTDITAFNISNDTTPPYIIATSYSPTSGNGPELNLSRARGTEASPSEVSNGDELGEINFSGRSTSGGQFTAAIRALADSVVTSRLNTGLAFYTGATTATLTERMRINSKGNVGIGNSPAITDSALTVTGGIHTTTSIWTGSDATINGIRVGRGGGNNVNNIAIGSGALSSADGTSNNNVAIGLNTLNAVTDVDNLVAIGINALSKTTVGDMTAVGANALQGNTTGYANVAIGRNALRENTTGANNTAVGGAAMFSNLSGSNNIAFGITALRQNTSGSNNIAIGAEALRNNTNANYNAAIGPRALFANTTGANNFALGTFALTNNLDGSNNIAIGNEAGRYNNSGSNVTKLDNSILIGYDARPSATSGNTGEVVIGYQGRGNGSNTTTIGNSSTTHTVLQYGETLLGYAASGDVGDYRVQVNGNGYVSGEFRIGYTADQGAYPLQVNGQIFATNATIATSDARLKQDIEPLKSGLKEVLSLNPVTYAFKPDTVNNYPKGKQVGFLAQEIQSTVQGDYAGSIVQEAGGYLGVADTKLIPLLVKAIQEQQAQIEALKKEIEALKNK